METKKEAELAYKLFQLFKETVKVKARIEYNIADVISIIKERKLWNSTFTWQEFLQQPEIEMRADYANSLIRQIRVMTNPKDWEEVPSNRRRNVVAAHPKFLNDAKHLNSFDLEKLIKEK